MVFLEKTIKKEALSFILVVTMTEMPEWAAAYPFSFI